MPPINPDGTMSCDVCDDINECYHCMNCGHWETDCICCNKCGTTDCCTRCCPHECECCDICGPIDNCTACLVCEQHDCTEHVCPAEGDEWCECGNPGCPSEDSCLDCRQHFRDCVCGSTRSR